MVASHSSSRSIAKLVFGFFALVLLMVVLMGWNPYVNLAVIWVSAIVVLFAIAYYDEKKDKEKK